MLMADGIVYYLDLNQYIYTDLYRSRNPVIFKTKISVKTVNNSFQPATKSSVLDVA